MGGTDSSDRAQREQEQARPNEKAASSVASKTGELPVEDSEKAGKARDSTAAEERRTVISIPSCRVQLPARGTAAPTAGESSESDDDEDFDVYFEQQISKTEAELRKLEDAIDRVPMRIVRRYAIAVHEALLSVVNDGVSLVDMVGPIPECFTFPCPKPGTEVPGKMTSDLEPSLEGHDQEMARATREPSALPTVEESDDRLLHPAEPQPKVEEVDTEGSGLPPVPALEEVKTLDEDVDMQDVSESRAVMDLPRRSVSPNGPTADELGTKDTEKSPAFFPHPFGQPEIESSPSPDEESEDRTDDDASIYGSVEVVREYSTTPPTEDLPVYNVKPWYRSRRVRKLAEESPEFGDFLLNHIRDQASAAQREKEELRREYAKNYESYLRFTLSDDPAAVKSRQYFSACDTQPGTNGKPGASESKPEGTRRAASRFATELDLDYALQQSMREHQERQEREERAQKEKYRSDKEAVIPDMFWTVEERAQASFYDTAGLLPLEKLVATWQVVPWHVNFTEEEAEKFEKAYLENPKQWGKISQELPDRDFGTCIQYYYAKKRELNLKEKLKKQPKRRKKGRGKQRSSALVSELRNAENETEETIQENGENGEGRRRPPRRNAAPIFGQDATPNADSDGATPAPTPGRRRAGTDAKNESGAEKPEAKKGGRRTRQLKADKEAKVLKQLAQAPAPSPGPLAVPGKTGRSRANSRAQGTEWLSPQTPLDLAARGPVPFEVPPGAMQPPLVPLQQPPLASSERASLTMASTMSEVMAPPSLRPEPPPPPASVPTFDISQSAAPERNRAQQQASSFWRVSETTDFPALLRSFGTDWNAIADHMKTKTATMVKNFYVRQTKEGGKPEWEQIAAEADAKGQRGEKRPAPPTPTQGPRRRYDVQPSVHRPLAAATEPDEAAPAKVEPPLQNQSFTRFQVPIAQAVPVSRPLSQAAAQPNMSAPLGSSAVAQNQPSGPSVTQAMSPQTQPLRPPASAFPYAEREMDQKAAQAHHAQQPVHISQKPVVTAAAIPAVSETVPRPAGWTSDLSQQLSLLSQQQAVRDARERQRLDGAPREPPRPVERPPLRMKQEHDQPLHPADSYSLFQPPQRVNSSRIEPAPLARQPEPPHPPPSTSQPFAPPVRSQPVRSMLTDRVSVQQAPQPATPASERPLASMQRPAQATMQEQYGATPVSAPPPSTPSQPPPQSTPTPSRPPERKTSSLMALLNDDPPPPPRRVTDMSSTVKPSSTPPPQSTSVRPQPPPTSTGVPPRSQVETGYPYAAARNPSQAPTPAIPPLKPYHTQSPQPQHMRVPSSSMASSMDPTAAEAQRDYYARHSYPSQRQTSATNSPQAHPAHHYAQPGQHPQQHPQPHVSQHPQQSQMGYQGQQSYHPYQVSQPHAPSPTPQYAAHPSMSSRREPPPSSGREPWPPAQQPMIAQQQQQLHHQQQQQHQQPPQQQQQTAWPPSHQAPPKANQPPVPAQSAWGAQHGVQAKPPVSSALPPQQHHTWPTSMSGQQPHPLNLREPPRASTVYGSHDTQGSPAGMVHHQQQQHGPPGGPPRYAPAPQDARRGEPVPPPPTPGQQYARYASTPGPGGQGRDPGAVRSYTPVSGFDPRGGPPPPPPPSAYAGQDALREAQLREAQLREMGGRDPREAAAAAAVAAAAQHQSILGRQLRPQDPYERAAERRYG
ncbi:hypothetical protein VTK56DRAFT_8798 [Thermocarpiscus australiensis]